MKRRASHLKGFAISGIDGELGKVKEFYFDDTTWTIRYVIVETGNWLSGRKVLLAPQSVTKMEWAEKVFRVNLTMEQIKNSPPIDTDKPVSRQHEMELYSYYPWGNHYGGAGMGGVIGMSYPISVEPVKEKDDSDDDHHLRSTKAVRGYAIKAIDGEIGDAEDFIIDDSNWKIDFVMVDTGHWFPGKKILISPAWIKEINWEDATLYVNASEAQVKSSPEYQPGEYLSERYEADLQKYYANVIPPMP